MQKVRIISNPPSYNELVAQERNMMSEVSTLQRQVQAKKAYGLVPDTVKTPKIELFIGTHDSKVVKTFLNACDMYFKLTGISDENNKALFAKTRLSDTEHTQYDSQGYDETTVTLETIKSYILDYFIPFNYLRRARRALITCKMGQRSATEYIDDFKKHLVNCRDIQEPKAKYLF